MKLIKYGAIQLGDVLLCYDSSVAEDTLAATGSSYSHAAICIDNNLVAESSSSGVRKITISDLTDTYERVAVFRPHPGCWTPSRIMKLNSFIGDAIKKGVRFNNRGYHRFEQNEESHNQSVEMQFHKYFTEGLQPDSPEKSSYFCSELVAAAFHSVGVLSESAAILYKPEAMSPAKLAQDPTFGLFVGYIKSYEGFEVPEDDEFLHKPLFSDVYPR